MVQIIHRGRLFDHVHIRVADLPASERFYRRILSVLGREITAASKYHFSADELFVTAATGPVSRVHLAFQAADKEMVKRFYEVALKAGAVDNGGPGYRDYHPGYYAAFVLDPDGHNLEAVYHGQAQYSAASVEVTIG